MPILVNKVKLDDLLQGDKNALILAARKSGYGNEYNTSIVCPKCQTKTNFNFDLGKIQNKYPNPDSETTTITENGTFLVNVFSTN